MLDVVQTRARVELAFRNNSLVIAGDVRLVQSVRAISVGIPKSSRDLRRHLREMRMSRHRLA